MVLTEAQLQEVAKRVAAIIRVSGSKNVGQLPVVDSLEGVKSLPAVRFNGGIPEPIMAPVSLLQQVATDSIEEVTENAQQAITDIRDLEKTVNDNESFRITEFNKLKTDAENATDNANIAADRVDESILDISKEKEEALAAAVKANESSGKADISAENADAKALLANLAAAAANSAASYATEKGDYADDAGATALAAAGTLDAKIQEKINALIANAPEALNTLVELAAALGNDPNFATTMATELAKKINKEDIINNLTTGGANKVASAEMVKFLNSTKLGSSFFATMSTPMTNDEFGAITNPDPTILYVVTLPN